MHSTHGAIRKGLGLEGLSKEPSYHRQMVFSLFIFGLHVDRLDATEQVPGHPAWSYDQGIGGLMWPSNAAKYVEMAKLAVRAPVQSILPAD